MRRHHIAAIGLLFAGFGVPTIDSLYNNIHMQYSTHVVVTGSPRFSADVRRITTQTLPPEITAMQAPDCGDARPRYAPEECGILQWKGYAETNPAAAAWMALVNTGDETCTVNITQLELSYLAESSNHRTATRRILSSNINGVQLLADGTNGKDWGTHGQDLPPGSTFTLPPDMHAYVHPFGSLVAVPKNATELTITFSAEVDDGCAISGGIDTFEEVDTPNTNPPYTKDGSVTDFIKEALKTPWLTETISADEPLSYSIPRLPRNERTGWYKNVDENF